MQRIKMHSGEIAEIPFLSQRVREICRSNTTLLGANKSTQAFFVQSFSTTLRVMDVRTENRGRPHQKVCFPAAPVVGRDFLTPEHSGVRVRSVRRKSGPKSLCLCFFSSLNYFIEISVKNTGASPRRMYASVRPYLLYGWDFPGEIPEKNPERPRKRSQSFAWDPPREYSWDTPNPFMQGI